MATTMQDTLAGLRAQGLTLQLEEGGARLLVSGLDRLPQDRANKIRQLLRTEKPGLVAALAAELAGDAAALENAGLSAPIWTYETRCFCPADVGRVLEATGTQVSIDGDDFRAVGGPKPGTPDFWRRWCFFRRHGDLINRWLREEGR